MIARIVAPKRLQARRWKNLLRPEPWLLPEISRAFGRDVAKTIASQRLWFADQVCDDVWRDRARTALGATLSAFAATANVQLVQPFQQAAFLRSVARYAGRGGWSSRSAAMKDLFGDVLPAVVANRATKAGFDMVFFHDHSREFVNEWDGTGVDHTLVDVEKLRSAWQQNAVDARSLSLLQAAWWHKNVSSAAGADGPP